MMLEITELKMYNKLYIGSQFEADKHLLNSYFNDLIFIFPNDDTN